MKYRLWIIFLVLIFFFGISIYYAIIEHYDHIVRFEPIEEGEPIIDYVLSGMITGHFVAFPFLALSIFGLLIRKNIGWTLILLYPYFTIIYFLYFKINFDGQVQYMQGEIMVLIVWTLLIALINLPLFRKFYRIEKTTKILIGNAVAALVGVAFCEWMLYFFLK